MKRFGEYCNQYNLKQGEVVRILANNTHSNLKNKLAVAYPFKPESGEEFTSSTQLRVAFKPLKSWGRADEGVDYFCIDMYAVEKLGILCTEHPDFKEMFKELETNKETNKENDKLSLEEVHSLKSYNNFKIADEVKIPINEDGKIKNFIYYDLSSLYRSGAKADQKGNASCLSGKGNVIGFDMFNNKIYVVVQHIDNIGKTSNAGYLPENLSHVSTSTSNKNVIIDVSISTSREFNIGDEVEISVDIDLRMRNFVYEPLPKQYKNTSSFFLKSNKGVIVDFLEHNSKEYAIVKCIDINEKDSYAAFLSQYLRLISSHKTNQNGQEPTTTQSIYKIDRPVAKISTGKRSGSSITAGRRSSPTIENRLLRKQEVFV
jgi:hypothetical protein